MASAPALTEELVHRIAPDDKAIQTARDLVRKKTFLNLGVSADGTWLLGACQGSGLYDISIDLANPNAPVGRCTCPSRKYPCKHVLGLLLGYVASPGAFTQQEPPPELVAKRERQAQRAEKKADAKPAPRKANKAAQTKKAAAQREGLDLLERLLFDLVGSGQWYTPDSLERLERQAKQMSDAYLPGAAITLRGLALVAGDPDHGARDARAADLIARLYATVRRGRNYLDGKLAGAEEQAEADAVLEEVLGHAWQLTELQEKGNTRENLQLMELAYERHDDPARRERIETSHLLDIGDGTVYRALSYRPFRGMDKIAGQPDYPNQILRIPMAGVYPGFLNRRIRWERGAEESRPLESADLAAAYGKAAAFEPVLASFRQQLRNPLAPREAVVLVACQTVGKVGHRVVMEDAKGARLEAVAEDANDAALRNLVRAAGMLLQPALAVRLELLAASNQIVARPLAALTPPEHLRLGT